VIIKLNAKQIAFVNSLRDGTGHVEASAIFEAARAPSCCLHELFEWNKDAIAKRYWLETAAAVIRACPYSVTTATGEVIVTVRFVKDERAPDAGRYVDTSVVGMNRNWSMQQLDVEIGRIRSAAMRAQGLAQAWNLEDEFFDALEELFDKLRPSPTPAPSPGPTARRGRRPRAELE
jgi:hypothetical protein